MLSTNDVLAPEGSRTTSGAHGPLHRYSIKRNSVVTMTSPASEVLYGFEDPTIVVSGDGQRVVAASDAGSTSDQRIWEYEASSTTNALTRAPVRFDVRDMYMDRTGDTLLVRGDDFFSAGRLTIGADVNGG